MPRRLVGSLVGVALAFLPAGASAHSELVSTSPEAGSTLDVAPAEVVMSFEGELDPDLSGFVVTDARGVQVGTGGVDLDVAERNVLRGSVEIVEPGVYTVTWTGASVDGHGVDGEFSFGYRTAPDAGEAGRAPDTSASLPASNSPLVIVGAALLATAALLGRRRLVTGRLLLAALPLLLAACVDQGRPDDAACSAPAIELEVTLTADALEPSGPAVCRDQEVTLRVDSQIDGTLHIHGYDDAVPATRVEAGETLDLTFTASRSGQFPVELHTDADPSGVSVGIFTVHEP